MCKTYLIILYLGVAMTQIHVCPFFLTLLHLIFPARVPLNY